MLLELAYHPNRNTVPIKQKVYHSLSQYLVTAVPAFVSMNLPTLGTLCKEECVFVLLCLL